MTDETRMRNKVEKSSDEVIRINVQIEALEKRIEMLYKILGTIALLVVGLVIDYFKG